MNTHDPAQRVYLCVVAAALLAGISFGYVQLTSRWLDVERTQERPHDDLVAQELTTTAPTSRIDGLEDGHWAHNAPFHFKDENRILVFQKFDDGETTSNDTFAPSSKKPLGQSMKISPVVIIWKNDDPNEEPVIVTANEAKIDLSQRVALMSETQQSARVISGTVSGEVEIRGPKNLDIRGHEFFVDENSMKLWSRHHVDFGWEGHVGKAKGGVEIHLERQFPDERGLATANGITRMRLDGPLRCNLNFPARRKDQDNIVLDVFAASHFEFNVHENLGVFYGLRDRQYTRETQVLVTRQTDGQPDELVCPELVLEFHPEVDPATGFADKNRLRIWRISALGQRNSQGKLDAPVAYSSPDQSILATKIERLSYLVAARQLDLFGFPKNYKVPSRPNNSSMIKIEQRISNRNGVTEVRTLDSPSLRVLQGQGAVVERIECPLPGRIQSTATAESPKLNDPDLPDATTVRWYGQMVVQRAPDGQTHKVSLSGGSSVDLPDSDMHLQAGTIDLTLLTPENDTTQLPAGRRGELSLDTMDAQPRLLVAQQDVILRSSRVDGEISEVLTVNFAPAPSVSMQSSNNGNASVESDSGPFIQDDNRNEDGRKAEFFGERLTATVLLAETPNEESRWNRIELTGPESKVFQRDTNGDQQYIATGNKFVAENGTDQNADIHVLGSIARPARIESAMGHAEGLQINLYQKTGTAKINGGGDLYIMVDQDLDGNPVPPTPIKVTWTDYMTMQGKLAHFVGGVRIELEKLSFSPDDELTHNIILREPELKVHFVRPVQLTGSDRNSGTSSQAPEIEYLHCVDRTLVDQDSFEDGQLVRILNAQLVDLKVWPATGRMTALGAGEIESTAKDDDESLSPPSGVSVQANVPTEIGHSAYIRVKARFVGHLEGNFTNRNVSLYNSVSISRVPVPELTAESDLENTPTHEMPELSGYLRARQVDIEETPGTNGEGFSMTARSNAQIVTRDFSGDADKITYDSAKEQFLLSAEGNRSVKAQQHAVGSRPAHNFNGPSVRYNSRTKQANGALTGAILN